MGIQISFGLLVPYSATFSSLDFQNNDIDDVEEDFFFKCWPVKERNYLKLTSELANVTEKLIKSSSCTIIVIAVAVPHSLIIIIIYLSQIIDTKLPFLWCCELLRVQIKKNLRRTK